MKRKLIVAVSLALAIVAIGCLCAGPLALGKSEDIQSFPTAPGVGDKSVLFYDDFSNPDSAWDQGSWNNGGADYYNGGYRVTVPSDINISAYLHQSFPQDVIVEVDVTAIGRSGGDLYAGIYCRNQSDGSGYSFTVGGDGTYGVATIGAFQQDTGTSIGTIQKKWEWPAGWPETYHIRMDCIGNQLSFYVNGYLVETATDAVIPSGGEVGFFGGRMTGTTMEYLFDNLVVYQP